MEIEFKFAVPPTHLGAVETAMAEGKTTTTRLQARYFDTADASLAAHGVALRLRREGTQWVQTAKAVLAGQGPLHRLEHNHALGAAGDGAPPEPDPRRHAGTPVGELIERLLGQKPLVQTMATDITRRAQHQTLNGTTVELALDVGQVSARGNAAEGAEPPEPRISPVCELELELVEGRVDDLVALAEAWCARHRLWLSTLSKAERGLRLALPAGTSHAVKAAMPHFGDGKTAKAMPAAAIQRAVLLACLAQVLPNASEVAAGNEETEVVHQLRVGIRRLRTALRELDGLDPSAAFDPAWQDSLTHVFRGLGTRRDAELLQTGLLPQLQAAGAPEMDPLPAAADDGHAEVPLADAVRAPAFQATLVALIGFTARDIDEDGEERRDENPRKPLRRRLQKLHRQVLRDGRRFEALSAEDQHRVRKRLKRLRYLAEFIGPLFGRKKAARYTARLEPAQDALGRFNDMAVALGRYREAAQRDPRAWFAVGWLGAQQAPLAHAGRKALARLKRLDRFWLGR